MEDKSYICLICEKEYNSYMGLWKHKKTKHSDKPLKNDSKICKYCNKEFSDRSNRWRHENTICKLKNSSDNSNTNENTNIESIVNSNINSTVDSNNNILTGRDNLTQNNIKHQTINKITILNTGCEDISILTQDEIEDIINNGFNFVIKLIELINFNKEHPQNHSFCTTNINSNYTTVINTETNQVDKKRKIDIFDKVLYYALNHIDMLKDRITNKKKKKEFTERIIDYEHKLFSDNEYKKIFREQLNELSYNRKNIVRKTWDNYLQNILVSNL